MTTPTALTYFSILVLVLQAPLCLASRPEASTTSRALLVDGKINPAGGECVEGELCSNGDGTTIACPVVVNQTTTNCPVVPAGLKCKTKDLCNPGAVFNGSTLGTQQPATLCPADPDTTSGTCPPVPAGSGCFKKDRCATSATTTTICPATGSNFTTCAALSLEASCSQLSGPCAGDLECSAAPPTFALNNPNNALLFAQDSTQGDCVEPKAAGSECTTGKDYCNGQAEGDADRYCPGSTCQMSRPGQDCQSTAPIDLCYDGDEGTPCAAPECPPLVAGAACFAGDACTFPQFCNAVGATEGKCVTTRAAGQSCTQGQICRVKTVDPAAPGGVILSAQVCPATNKCPLIPAGQACDITQGTADFCSNGTVGGVVCPNTACATIVGNGACYLGDKCDDVGKFCSATGTTDATKGACKTPKLAGEACVVGASPTATDVCGSTGSLCPASEVCPPIPAGAACEVGVDTDTTEKCFNGNADPTAATSDCPGNEGSQVCPALETGLACGPNDLCVKGAKCINNKCYPNNKVFSSPPGPTPTAVPVAKGFTTAATVPAVKSTAKLIDREVEDFDEPQEKAAFCKVVQDQILANFKVVSNCTVTNVKPGSVNVDNTIAFTGSDAAAAKAAQTAVAAKLTSDPTGSSVFGTTYGAIEVSAVSQPDLANPTTSGAAAVGMAWTVGAALMITAFVMTV